MDAEICPICPWSQDVSEPIVHRIMQYANLLSAGCPVEKNDLVLWEWNLVGIVRAELEKIAHEEIKKRSKRHG